MRNLKTDLQNLFTRQAKGINAENACRIFLQKQNIKIINGNFHSKFGEIDLIGTKNDTLIFFEIRHREKQGYGTALESVTPAKQHRIYKTALFFLMKHPHFNHFTYRFDIIGTSSYNGELVFDWQQNAFQPPFFT